ncbi:MAG: hypothetical protein ACJAS3_001706 [Roseivirga sp.]|jgi:hypothetical protein
MKFILSTSLILASLFFSHFNTKEVSPFEIEVQRNGDSVKMKCTEGCKWTELKFELKGKNPMVINESGVYKKTTYTGEPDVSFAFYVNDLPDGLEFESINGTAWGKLSFQINPSKSMYLDETGVSMIRQK